MKKEMLRFSWDVFLYILKFSLVRPRCEKPIETIYDADDKWLSPKYTANMNYFRKTKPYAFIIYSFFLVIYKFAYYAGEGERSSEIKFQGSFIWEWQEYVQIGDSNLLYIRFLPY